MDVKKSLATELVTRFHGNAAAETAQNYFETRFQKKITPSEIHQRFVDAGADLDLPIDGRRTQICEIHQ